MKPREQKPETCFRIIDRDTGKPVGSYSRAYCDEYDFNSADEARAANCHGIFKDKKKYAIAKYKVTYELLDDDVDGRPMGDVPPCPCGGQIQEEPMESPVQRIVDAITAKFNAGLRDGLNDTWSLTKEPPKDTH